MIHLIGHYVDSCRSGAAGSADIIQFFSQITSFEYNYNVEQFGF